MTKTIFCDLDGCILYHPQDYIGASFSPLRFTVLGGAKDKLLSWHIQGFKIIITTGRPDSQKEELERLLAHEGVFFHKLITDCGSGPRYLINDREPGKLTNKAFAINLDRNVGIWSVDLYQDSTS
jgi:hydroxymethylpyrimidine pyrophosphatase-like HAD family hydrolase